MAFIANPVRFSALPGSFVLKTRFFRLPEKREAPAADGFSGAALRSRQVRKRSSVESPAMRSGHGGGGPEGEVPKKKRVKKRKSSAQRFDDILDQLHTLLYLLSWVILGFIYICWFGAIRYLLNPVFTILTKEVYNYFPFPYFVSIVHLSVGIAYWFVIQSVDLRLGPPGKPMKKELLLSLIPVAACHTIGYVLYNVSVSSVAVSYTHTITALELFFNAVSSKFVLAQHIPVSLWLPLVPIIIGVSMASLVELSFTWVGFISAMISSVSFTCKNVFYKNVDAGEDNDAYVFACISAIALLFCIPIAVFVEGPKLLEYGFNDAVAKVGLRKFLSDLFWSGFLSHVYYRFVAADTHAEGEGPWLHAVGNAMQRVVGVGLSVVVFGNGISTQTGIGTAMVLAGVAAYNLVKANIITKEKQEAAAAWDGTWKLRKDLAKRNAAKDSK